MSARRVDPRPEGAAGDRDKAGAISSAREHPKIQVGALSIVLRGRYQRSSPSRGDHQKRTTNGEGVRYEPVSQIGCHVLPPLEEIQHAARYVACPFTQMDPPTTEGARVVFDLILRMATGDMEAVAEFQRFAEGPSPWEALGG